MANRYWVGGGSSTNWDAAGNTNWSGSDGGANNASVPANGDDVFLKSSVDCNQNVNTANLNSFDMTGYTGTFSRSGGDLILNPSSGTVTCLFAGTVTWDGRLALEPEGTATINLTTGGTTIPTIFLSGYLGFN